jgi:tRNA (guanine-N7-)-methyltransferase
LRRVEKSLKNLKKFQEAIQCFNKAIEIDPLNLPEFPNEVIFEIGFGGGENLAHQAQKYPNALCIGCEPFVNGIASLLQTIEEESIQNIRIFADDANILLKALLDQVITKGFILFPDPWPKKRHHKRRVVCLENLLLLYKKNKKSKYTDIH